jgi:hypothetical protein
MQGPEVLVPITAFLCLGATFILRGPLGKAWADRIAGRTGPDDAEVQSLRADVEDLRARLGETEERLDFAERLLSNQRDAEQLPRSGKGS